MRKVCTVHGIPVAVYTYISAYRSPKSHAIHRHNILHATVHTTYVHGKTSFLEVRAVQGKAVTLSSFLSLPHNVVVTVYYHVSFHHVRISRRNVLVLKTVDVQRRQYLLFLVKHHVCVLNRLKITGDKSQYKGNGYDHYRRVHYYICIGICVQTPLTFIFHIPYSLFSVKRFFLFDMLRLTTQ